MDDGILGRRPHKLPRQRKRHELYTSVVSVRWCSKALIGRPAGLASRGASERRCFLVEVRCMVQRFWVQDWTELVPYGAFRIGVASLDNESRVQIARPMWPCRAGQTWMLAAKARALDCCAITMSI